VSVGDLGEADNDEFDPELHEMVNEAVATRAATVRSAIPRLVTTRTLLMGRPTEGAEVPFPPLRNRHYVRRTTRFRAGNLARMKVGGADEADARLHRTRQRR
jgi:hypothetical protein